MDLRSGRSYVNTTSSSAHLSSPSSYETVSSTADLMTHVINSSVVSVPTTTTPNAVSSSINSLPPFVPSTSFFVPVDAPSMFTQTVAPTTMMQGFGTVAYENVIGHSQSMFVPCYTHPPNGSQMSNPPISTYRHAPLPALTTQLPRNGNVAYAPEADMDRLSLDAVPSRAPYDLLRRNAVIERFDGSNRFPAEIWITAYEALTEGMPDRNRISLLMQYVEKDAFRWYAQFVIPHRHVFDWPTVRSLYIEKFTKMDVKPIVAANARFLQPRESIQSYFDEKTRLLELARIPEDVMIDLLREGLPDSYRTVVSARQPETLSDWLRCVKTFETPKRMEAVKAINVAEVRQKNDTRTRGQIPQRPVAQRGQQDDVSPSSPCPRCLFHGKTEYHWARICSYPKPEPRSQRDQSRPIKWNPPVNSASGSLNSRSGSQTM